MHPSSEIPLIIGNWKAYKTISSAQDFIKSWIELLENSSQEPSFSEVVLCPPVSLLHCINKNITLGAQDCSGLAEVEGPFTGDITAAMLKDSGCKYVIIGHSERRKYSHDSNQLIKQKMEYAHKAGLIAILCVGETLEQRENGSYKQILAEQLDESMAQSANVSNLIIAYEPVWAIGSGKVARIDQIEEIHQYLSDKCLSRFAQRAKIIYGGSVNVNNAQEILSAKMVSGLLIGGASLDVQAFYQITKMERERNICN
jgi:triosephosphate isomerase